LHAGVRQERELGRARLCVRGKPYSAAGLLVVAVWGPAGGSLSRGPGPARARRACDPEPHWSLGCAIGLRGCEYEDISRPRGDGRCVCIV